MSSKRVRPRPSESGGRTGSKRPWSLARLLTAWYAFSALTLVLASTAVLYWGLARLFEQSIDKVLQERIQVLRGLLRDGDASRGQLKWEVESEREGFKSPLVYLRILGLPDWRLETPGMSEFLPAAAFPAAVGPDSPGRVRRLNGAAGRAFRVTAASARVGVNGDSGCVIQAAFDLTAERGVLRSYRYLLVLVLIGAALISPALGYRIARRGMQPLEEIVEAVKRIRSSTLTERVRLKGLPAELADLSDNFNKMLDRLEQAFASLSRFTADLAHELRTPLNNLRGEAEVALSKSRSAEEYREVLASSLEEYASLSQIIDSFLFLAWAERSETPIARERVELIGELRAIAEFYEPAAAEKGLTLRVESVAELYADVDRVLFRRAVSNLVSNAVAYTPCGAICLHAVEQDSAIRVEVSDTGIGIRAEHLPRVFDRFYRVDGGSRRSAGGMGLGLSIVKTIMDLHNGSAEISSEPGRGTRASLIFPRITRS